MSKSTSHLLFLAALAVAILGVYLPGLGNALVFDDGRLTDGTIFGTHGSLLELRLRMLSYGSFVWVHALLGENWWAQRLVNVLLHAGVCLGLYALFGTLLRRTELPEEIRNDPGLEASRTAALRAGIAVFALNPVAVYAVAYLVQRSIVMATLFVVLACLAWVRALVTGRAYWLVLALLAYLLAVLSKETAVMAVALAPPLYIFVARPSRGRMLAVTLATLAIIAAAGLLLLQVYGSVLGAAFDESSRLYVRQLEQLSPGISGRLLPLSILNQAALFFQYGFLWFVPNVLWMSIDLRPPFPTSLASFPQVLGALGFLLVAAGSAWLLARRSNAAGFIGLCLLGAALLFSIEFATVWVQDPFVLYRSYLWALFVPGLVALPLVGFSPRLIYPVAVGVGLLFGALALERNLSLRDPLSVWSDAAQKIDRTGPPNAVGRGRPFLNRGAYYLERELPDYALNDFAQAEALGEGFGSARFNMGVSQQMMKRHADALASFGQAESMGFTEPALYFQRGQSLLALGRHADAMEAYSAALTRSSPGPFLDEARFRRAEAATLVGRYDLAIGDLQALLQQKPGQERLMMSLGMAYVGKEDPAAALAAFNGMLARRPSAGAYYGRGLAHWIGGDKAQGLRDIDQAIALEPANPLFRNMRARLSAQK